MIHNENKSLDEKEKIIKEVFNKDDDLINRLFFMAKNGAISRILREFEHFFMDKDMKVKAEWKEDYKFASIHLKLITKTNGHERTISIKRSKIHPEPKGISPCLYSLYAIANSEYYRSKKPKAAVDFDEILGSEEFAILAEKLIRGVNYPFVYESQSSC